MPIIQFNLMEGRSEATKRELAKRVCETVCDVLGSKPEAVRILIHELGGNDFSVAGITVAEKQEVTASSEVCYDED